MKKQQYDVLVKALELVNEAQERVVKFVDTAENVLDEVEANVVQILDSVESKISEMLVNDPVEDIVGNRNGSSLLDTLLGNLAKGKTGGFDWSKVTDKVNDFTVDAGKHKAEDETPDFGTNFEGGNLSREEKVAFLVKSGLPNWDNPAFEVTKTDGEVNAAFLGAKLGEQLLKMMKKRNGGFDF